MNAPKIEAGLFFIVYSRKSVDLNIWVLFPVFNNPIFPLIDVGVSKNEILVFLGCSIMEGFSIL